MVKVFAEALSGHWRGGGRNVAACQSQIYGATGVGAIIGGVLGSVVPVIGTGAGAALGAGIGGMVAGGHVVGNSSSCVG